MGKRISETAWRLFNEQHSDAVKNLTTFVVPFDKQNIFPRKFRRKASKNNTERFGIELGPAIDWLDNNTNNEYYAKIYRESNGHRIMEVIFYFYDEYDAMAFKLVFGDKT